MKILGILCIFALSCQFTHSVHLNDVKAELVQNIEIRSINDKFKAALENFKETMKSGNDKLGIPKLDPFTLDKKSLKVEETIFNGEIEVNKVNVEGLSNYVVQNADFKIAKWNVAIDFLWPNIKGKTGYSIHGHIFDKLSLYGGGDVTFEVIDFHFSTEVKLKVNFKTKEISITSFNNTVVAVKEFKLDITGLYEDDDISKLASAVISDVIPETITEFQEEVTQKVNEALKENGNMILKKFKVDDIIGIIH